jgi:hypothetical protein
LVGCLLRFTIAMVGVGALLVVCVYAYTSTPLPL